MRCTIATSVAGLLAALDGDGINAGERCAALEAWWWRRRLGSPWQIPVDAVRT